MAVPTFEEVISAIQKLPRGMVIPKPRATTHRIDRWGDRQGEAALIYSFPKNKEKGITIAEWRTAYHQLINEGAITREWFNDAVSMQRCCSEGGCNFTTIGGIFTLIGLARRGRVGTYLLNNN